MGVKTKTYRVIGPTDLDGRTQKLGAEHTFQVREDGSTIVSKDKKNWQEIIQTAPAPVVSTPAPAPAPVVSEAERLDVDQVIIKDMKDKEAAPTSEIPFEVISPNDQNNSPAPAGTPSDKKNTDSILDQ